jgi:hypothetical protein
MPLTSCQVPRPRHQATSSVLTAVARITLRPSVARPPRAIVEGRPNPASTRSELITASNSWISQSRRPTAHRNTSRGRASQVSPARRCRLAEIECFGDLDGEPSPVGLARRARRGAVPTPASRPGLMVSSPGFSTYLTKEVSRTSTQACISLGLALGPAGHPVATRHFPEEIWIRLAGSQDGRNRWLVTMPVDFAEHPVGPLPD